MYEITRDNLIYAYKKLKHNMYFYSSSNYLKVEMLDFERQWKSKVEMLEVFETMSKELNDLKEVAPNTRLHYSQVGYEIYPKKEVFVEKEVGRIEAKEVNAFINMPIKYYLVDILFILNIYEKCSERFDSNLMYGNVFDDEFKKSNEKLKNPLLFENHYVNYRKWINSPCHLLENNVDEKILIIRFDIKRCFYNFEFNIRDFIKEVFTEYSLINDIECELHNYYTSIINTDCLERLKITNRSLLPIGLLSSSVILNYYLAPLDQELDRMCYSYARYTDDVLLSLPYNASYEGKNVSEILVEAFPEKFEQQPECLDIITPNGKKLPINQSKNELRVIERDDFLNLEQVVTEMIPPSTVEPLNFERRTATDVSNLSVSELRKILYDSSNSVNYKKERLFRLSSAEILNAYPVWKCAFGLFENTNDAEILRDKIAMAIEKIVYDDSSFFGRKDISSLIKHTMRKELRVSFERAMKDNEYKHNLISDITQTQIIEYIDNKTHGRETGIFPLMVTLNELMFYLQTELGINVCADLIAKAGELYQKINDVSYERNSLVDIAKLDTYTSVSKRMNDLERNGQKQEEKKVKVAIVNLNISKDEIEKYDFDKEYYPNGLSISEIIRLIDSAKNHGADYIVFPEFAIKYDEAFNIINRGMKKKITIIAGLTHRIEGDKAYNYVMVFSNELKHTYVHKKRYMAPEEKKILKERGYIGIDSENKYFIIDDSKMKYTIMTCYEATNIEDRAIFKEKVDAVFMPVFNKDTFYFSNIVYSFTRDIYAYIVQSNVNGYGDSRITGPLKSYLCDVVRLKGGNNNYVVIGELDFSGRELADSYYLTESKEYPDNEKTWKPRSAGNELANHIVEDGENILF